MEQQQITAAASIGDCRIFQKEEDGPYMLVSMVISPLKINTTALDTKLSFGCNLWKVCRNRDCWYSMASREESQKERS